MNHDAIIAKIRKLLALAQRGEGGEAVNARDLLDKMLKKYGIDEASLTDIRTLRYSAETQEEQGLLSVVASYALQIPTADVNASVIVASDAYGSDLKMSVEQHGLVASLYEYHRMGLDRSIQRFQDNQEGRAEEIRAEIKALRANIKTLTALLSNLGHSMAQARNSLLCAYVNLNNLTDYTGWGQADDVESDNIASAAASCVKLDPNAKQLPGQRLGNPTQHND